MAVDYYSLKIASEKVELIQETLGKIDEAVALVSAFTTTDENKELIAKLIENIDDVKQIVGSVDLMETTTDDINKGTYLGSRKLDIDLSLNKTGIAETLSYEAAMALWTNTTNTVYYNKATCTFVDGTVIVVNFVNDDGQPIQVSTHGAIIDQLMSHTAFTAKLEDSVIMEDIGGKTGSIIRIADVIGKSSNIERIQLNVSAGASVSTTPVYYWALSTSALQTLANRVGDIIKLGNSIDDIIVVSNSVDEMLELQTALPILQMIYNNLAELLQVNDNVALAESYRTQAGTYASNASNSANSAAQKASEASSSAILATQKADEIKKVTVGSTITAVSGSLASVTYNPVTGKFSFVIPEGQKGDKGDNFTINATGLVREKPTYNAQPKGFSFLALDEGKIYFKVSATSGDWSAGISFGKGDTGSQGVQGVGIIDVDFTSTTHASGLAGQSAATDTYTITMSDASTQTFIVYNGRDSDLTEADLLAHTDRTDNPHAVSKEQVGLSNVDNTSDKDKPISDATLTELNKKLSKTIDNFIDQLNVTAFNYVGADLISVVYEGGYKVIYSYQNGNLYQEKFYDIDQTTLLLTKTYAYTNNNLTGITRS